MATNFAIALLVAALTSLIGIKALLLVHLPIVLFAATAGVWLFFVQHQFEYTTWEQDERWNLHQAALYGSSHYDLPTLLRWFTANIGIHHVHHLCSRIPYYRLPRVLRDHSELREVGRVTLLQSFRYVRLVLWDEAQCRLVSFHEIRDRDFPEAAPRPPSIPSARPSQRWQERRGLLILFIAHLKGGSNDYCG